MDAGIGSHPIERVDVATTVVRLRHTGNHKIFHFKFHFTKKYVLSGSQNSIDLVPYSYYL